MPWQMFPTHLYLWLQWDPDWDISHSYRCMPTTQVAIGNKNNFMRLVRDFACTILSTKPCALLWSSSRAHAWFELRWMGGGGHHMKYLTEAWLNGYGGLLSKFSGRTSRVYFIDDQGFFIFMTWKNYQGFFIVKNFNIFLQVLEIFNKNGKI